MFLKNPNVPSRQKLQIFGAYILRNAGNYNCLKGWLSTFSQVIIIIPGASDNHNYNNNFGADHN